MKYLIISDTHGYITDAVEAIKKHSPDYCIHLGDMAQDCEDLEAVFPMQKFIFVKGNNDVWLRNNMFPDERVFNLDGKTFFLTHGHKFYVKSGLDALKKAATERNADIVLYGHTHIQKLEEDSGLLIINPGARGKYAILTIDNDNVKSELY